MAGDDNNNNNPSIPSWQRAAAPSSPPSPPSDVESQPESKVESTREDASSSTPENSDATLLLHQAAKFLEDPTIRDAPREKKSAFLESKGVSREGIQKLLGEVEKETHVSGDVARREQSILQAPASQSAPSSQPSPPQPASSSQPKELPPIVTYPEFLAQPSPQPPLITTQRLVNTAYITGGLVATLYGLSKYIVAPMTESLTASRHEFALHTQDKVSEFNKRLSRIVSVDPQTKIKATMTQDDQNADDVSEADSDPTELFHRDFGTQTSPSISRRPSVSESPKPEDPGSVTAHQNRIKVITSHLRELEASRSNDHSSSQSLKSKIADLTSYLTEMSYSNSYSYSGMGGLYPSGYGTKSKDKKEDQVEVLRADIRAVKGVLLSARNFPTGGVRTLGK